MKILVIDDNPTFGRIFVKRLKLKGFLVDYATTLRDGLRRFETEKFHVVFIDTPFPMISEPQVLEMLQQNNIFNKSSVFLFSSIDINQTDLNEWKTSGLFSYIKKPVKFNEIIKNLENVKIDSSYSISENHTSDDALSYNDTFVSNSDEQLTQLQNQIRELEQHVEDSTTTDVSSNTVRTADTAGSTDVATPQVFSDTKVDLFTEKMTAFQNIITTLKSFNSLDFGTNTSKPLLMRNDGVSKTTIEQEIKDTLSEIDLLRKDLLLLDDHSSQDTDGKKKHKITTMSKNNAPKSGKKSSVKKTTTKKTRKTTTKKTRKTTKKN